MASFFKSLVAVTVRQLTSWVQFPEMLCFLAKQGVPVPWRDASVPRCVPFRVPRTAKFPVRKDRTKFPAPQHILGIASVTAFPQRRVPAAQRLASQMLGFPAHGSTLHKRYRNPRHRRSSQRYADFNANSASLLQGLDKVRIPWEQLYGGRRGGKWLVILTT